MSLVDDCYDKETGRWKIVPDASVDWFDENWRDRAACKGTDWSLWFGTYVDDDWDDALVRHPKADKDVAFRYCRACPVLESCLKAEMDGFSAPYTDEVAEGKAKMAFQTYTVGIRGGMAQWERERLRSGARIGQCGCGLVRVRRFEQVGKGDTRCPGHTTLSEEMFDGPMKSGRAAQPPRFSGAEPLECEADDCQRTDKMRRGLCALHYQRWYDHGDPNWLPPKPRKRCVVDGCDHPGPWRQDMCEPHYRRARRAEKAQKARSSGVESHEEEYA